MRRVALLLGLVGLLMAPRSAWAQATASDADRLFHEGRELLKQGHLEEACDKLAQSQRLDPSSGTLMNLAHCHEQLGKFASAFEEFSLAAQLAASRGAAQREAEARRRAAALEPRLSYLVVRVVKTVPELKVECNGNQVEQSALGHPLPVDPGVQALRATAPGHLEWTLSLTITQPGELVVEVPQLTPESVVGPPRPDSPPVRPEPQPRAAELPPAEAPQARGLPPTFWIAAGTGVVAAGIATVAGVMSLASYDEADSLCGAPHENCSPDAMSARHRAETQATVSNIATGTAVVAVGVGVYLFVTSRHAAPKAGLSSAGRLASTPTLSWSW